MRKQITIAVIAACFIGCQQETTKLTENEKSKIVAEIKELTVSILKSGSERDATRLYSHFSDSVAGVFDGVVMGLWKEHKKEGQAFFGAQREIKYTIDSIYNTKVFSNDVAILDATYSMTATDTLGNAINSSSAFTYIFNKENGNWKVVYFHDSSKLK